jgi:HSP20 family molecular chaperone IbpA
MFFATSPASFRHPGHLAAGRSLERFLSEAQLANRQGACAIEQDEKFYTLRFDVPGIAKDQLSVGIEGAIVRIESKEGASRQYKSAYELPQDIDAGSSEASMENGVLTLKLAKQVPASRVTALTIN